VSESAQGLQGETASGSKGAQRKQEKRSGEEREVVMFAIGGCSCRCERAAVEHDEGGRSGGAGLDTDITGHPGGIRARRTAVGWVFGDGQGGASKHEVQAGCGRTDLKRVGGRLCASPAFGPRHWRPGYDERLSLSQLPERRPEREERCSCLLHPE
jgi:hypothetical protein